MKILVCGDIHCKPEIIEQAVQIDGWDKFVFLGDMCDNWGATQEDNIKTVEAVAALKNKYGDKFVWIVGNHDWAYYDNSIRISGHLSVGEENIKYLMKKYVNDWELVHFDGKYVFSHAGITADFLKFTEGISLRDMKLIIGEDNPVNMVGKMCGGSDPSPSFLWTRPEEFYPLPDEFNNIQVVGHTPVGNIVKHGSLIICDTMSQYPDKTFIGDKSLLLINTDTDKLKALNLDGEELYEIL